MPRLQGYKYRKGFNIPVTTKGKRVEECLARVYPALRTTSYPGESKRNKRIASAISHKICG